MEIRVEKDFGRSLLQSSNPLMQQRFQPANASSTMYLAIMLISSRQGCL